MRTPLRGMLKTVDEGDDSETQGVREVQSGVVLQQRCDFFRSIVVVEYHTAFPITSPVPVKKHDHPPVADALPPRHFATRVPSRGLEAPTETSPQRALRVPRGRGGESAEPA